MERKPIGKERLGAKVLFPRSQYKGLTMAEGDTMPRREDYELREVQVEGMGKVRMVRSTKEPHHTMQVFETQTEQEFDDRLGTLLGMHETPAYVEGDLTFMVLFVGSEQKVELTQANWREVDADICRDRDQAARWWKLYGKQVVKI